MTNPATLQSLRDRLAALGIPADDLPDSLVPLVTGLAEDRERLDWIEYDRVGIRPDMARNRWLVHINGEIWSRSGPMSATLRVSIDDVRQTFQDARHAPPAPVPPESPSDAPEAITGDPGTFWHGDAGRASELPGMPIGNGRYRDHHGDIHVRDRRGGWRRLGDFADT